MRPSRSRARRPVSSESSIALRKASASASRFSARARRRPSRTSSSTTTNRLIDKPSTSAVARLGIRLGPRCTASTRTCSVVPGKSTTRSAMNTPPPRTDPLRASRVPSASTKLNSWLRPTSATRTSSSSSGSTMLATVKPTSRPACCTGVQASITSTPLPPAIGTNWLRENTGDMTRRAASQATSVSRSISARGQWPNNGSRSGDSAASTMCAARSRRSMRPISRWPRISASASLAQACGSPLRACRPCTLCNTVWVRRRTSPSAAAATSSLRSWARVSS